MLKLTTNLQIDLLSYNYKIRGVIHLEIQGLYV